MQTKLYSLTVDQTVYHPIPSFHSSDGSLSTTRGTGFLEEQLRSGGGTDGFICGIIVSNKKLRKPIYYLNKLN